MAGDGDAKSPEVGTLSAETRISYVENPKKSGSKSFERYEGYKHASTVAEARRLGASNSDIMHDWQKGFLKTLDGAVAAAIVRKGIHGAVQASFAWTQQGIDEMSQWPKLVAFFRHPSAGDKLALEDLKVLAREGPVEELVASGTVKELEASNNTDDPKFEMREVDPPPGLPAGWKAFRKTLEGFSLRMVYVNELDESVEAVRAAVQKDAIDRGLNVGEALKAYEVAKTSTGLKPPEADEDFEPQGVSRELLDALPQDAPRGHAAWYKCVLKEDSCGKPLIKLNLPKKDGRTEAMQITLGAVSGFCYAAFRIARAMYVKYEAGVVKNEVLDFRTECLAKLIDAEARAQEKARKSGKKAKRTAQEKPRVPAAAQASSSSSKRARSSMLAASR